MKLQEHPKRARYVLGRKKGRKEERVQGKERVTKAFCSSFDSHLYTIVVSSTYLA